MKHQYHQHQHHNDASPDMMFYKHLQAASIRLGNASQRTLWNASRLVRIINARPRAPNWRVRNNCQNTLSQHCSFKNVFWNGFRTTWSPHCPLKKSVKKAFELPSSDIYFLRRPFGKVLKLPYPYTVTPRTTLKKLSNSLTPTLSLEEGLPKRLWIYLILACSLQHGSLEKTSKLPYPYTSLVKL